jgi:fatty acid-binding protein DegV
VRTSGRALARLADLAVEAAGESNVDIAVQHLAAADRAQALFDLLIDRLGERARERYLSEVGAVVAAHTGPGVIGVTVHRHADTD